MTSRTAFAVFAAGTTVVTDAPFALFANKHDTVVWVIASCTGVSFAPFRFTKNLTILTVVIFVFKAVECLFEAHECTANLAIDSVAAWIALASRYPVFLVTRLPTLFTVQCLAQFAQLEIRKTRVLFAAFAHWHV